MKSEGIVLAFHFCVKRVVGWFPSNGGDFSLFLSCDKTVKILFFFPAVTVSAGRSAQLTLGGRG